MRQISRTGLLALVAFGAVATTACDAVHVHTGTLAYTNPGPFGQPWWVLPQFIVAFALMTVSYLLLADRAGRIMPTGRSREQAGPGPFVVSMTLFVAAYVVTGLANHAPALLSIVLYPAFFLRWAAMYERAWLLLLASLMAVGGMSAEGLISGAGLFQYRQADIFQVPFWLGALYMHGAFSLREGMRFFVYRPEAVSG